LTFSSEGGSASGGDFCILPRPFVNDYIKKQINFFNWAGFYFFSIKVYFNKRAGQNVKYKTILAH
jgi:hypothetical protein